MPANFPDTAPCAAPCPDRKAAARAGALDFTEIYQAHAKAIYYLALRSLGDAARAEDATHDVFLKAFRHLADFRGESEIRTWLYRIALNHVKNLRSTWHQRNVIQTEDGNPAEGTASELGTPLRIAESRDLGRSIQRALDLLPEDYRVLLLLVADEELSYEEIGNLTGQSSDAVRGKLYRARKAFATAFRQHT